MRARTRAYRVEEKFALKAVTIASSPTVIPAHVGMGEPRRARRALECTCMRGAAERACSGCAPARDRPAAESDEDLRAQTAGRYSARQVRGRAQRAPSCGATVCFACGVISSVSPQPRVASWSYNVNVHGGCSQQMPDDPPIFCNEPDVMNPKTIPKRSGTTLNSYTHIGNPYKQRYFTHISSSFVELLGVAPWIYRISLFQTAALTPPC